MTGRQYKLCIRGLKLTDEEYRGNAHQEPPAWKPRLFRAGRKHRLLSLEYIAQA